jgi:hypothetical protein
VRRRTNSLDELHVEVDYVLQADGTRFARLVLRVAHSTYWFRRAALSLLLHSPWRRRGS